MEIKDLIFEHSFNLDSQIKIIFSKYMNEISQTSTSVEKYSVAKGNKIETTVVHRIHEIYEKYSKTSNEKEEIKNWTVHEKLIPFQAGTQGKFDSVFQIMEEESKEEHDTKNRTEDNLEKDAEMD